MKNLVIEDDGIKISANLSNQTNNVYFCTKLKKSQYIILHTMKKTKLLLIFAIVLGTFQWAFAAPLKNIPVRLTQPDGQVIECFASGDEFYNYVHDANGFTIVKGDGGYYCYAMRDSQGEVVASPYRVNSVDPASVGLQPYAMISEQAYQQRRHEREQYIQPVKKPADRELNHGRYNNLVVFIRFAGDTYHTTSFSTVDSMFNANNYESVSMHNYFHHASYNQLDLHSYFYPTPEGETILSYEDDYPKEYYMPYDPVTNPLGYQDGETAEREFSLLERAIYYVADQVSDTLDLDYNHDGNVDNVVFVIKGAPGAWASLLWPHRWSIYDRYVWLNGLRVLDFNLQLEIGGYFNVSTLCHEMNHSLGAPDLYHYNGGPDAVGGWDLMCSNASPPQHMGAYMKYKYGNWIDDIPEITEYGTYELEATSWEGNRRNVYRIASNDPEQFYLIEYRDKRRMFDKSLPDGGLLIYRIDTRFGGNAGYNGQDQFDEVYIFHPNGYINNSGNIDAAAYSVERGHTVFNHLTNPAPFYTNGQIDEHFCIYNVSSIGDRMSFSYGPVDYDIIPRNLITHVNAQSHQVVLRWDPVPDVEGYVIYRDGELLADNITEPTYSHDYTSADNGYHTYRVSAIVEGDVSPQCDPQWIILGNYENLRLSIATDSPWGTKGGELEVSFGNAMPTQYLTVYEGSRSAEAEYYIPANTEVTIRWAAGFDPESEGIRVSAIRFNQNGETEVFDTERPQTGVLATYTAADDGLGLIAPQHLRAFSEGQDIHIDWTIPTENQTFDIYRGDRKILGGIESYDYLDNKIMRSGTYRYHVETTLNGISTWTPELSVHANAMNFYCEPPRNLEGSYDNGHIELTWEAPESVGQGLLAYDDNTFVNQIGTSNTKWGIKIAPENLAMFAGRPLTHIEIFDCSAGRYTFTIYNGTATNNSTTLYVQVHDMEGSNEFVKFALDEPVDFDPTLPLWICVATANTQQPIPCCDFVGEDNSCLVKSGAYWRPATMFDMNYSWLLRAYTSPINVCGDFTYNVYWGPEEGSEEQLVLGYEALTATQAEYNTTDNMRYNVTAIWDGRETELSNTVYLGPSVDVEENVSQEHALTVYPNPVSDQLTLQGEGIQYVSLITIAGACVYESAARNDEVKIDMTNLPQGLYFLRVQHENEMVVKKVVKY